jgi:hypothetical protein
LTLHDAATLLLLGQALNLSRRRQPRHTDPRSVRIRDHPGALGRCGEREWDPWRRAA